MVKKEFNVLMKRFLFIVVLFLSTLMANAQYVQFKLFYDGSFCQKNGLNYTIVQFAGKSAHQIYQALFINASEVYKNPKQKVIITIDGSSINIRAYDTKLTFREQGEYLSGYYTLHFDVKDGKVKVDAPIVDETLVRAKDGVPDRDFTKLIRSWHQEANLMTKYQDNASYTESEFNRIINNILTGNIIDDSDNW